MLATGRSPPGSCSHTTACRQAVITRCGEHPRAVPTSSTGKASSRAGRSRSRQASVAIRQEYPADEKLYRNNSRSRHSKHGLIRRNSHATVAPRCLTRETATYGPAGPVDCVQNRQPRKPFTLEQAIRGTSELYQFGAPIQHSGCKTASNAEGFFESTRTSEYSACLPEFPPLSSHRNPGWV